jgi:hypothetical protein
VPESVSDIEADDFAADILTVEASFGFAGCPPSITVTAGPPVLLRTIARWIRRFST